MSLEVTKIDLSGMMKIHVVEVPGSKSVAAEMHVSGNTRVRAGLPHMCEHVVVEGSRRFGTYRAYTERVGSVGGDCWQDTGLESTRYGIHIPNRNAPGMLDILSDVVLSPTLAEHSLDQQRPSVIREIAEASASLLDYSYYATHAYMKGEPFGVHPILGNVDDVIEISADDITTYHSQSYVPGNVNLVVAGAMPAKAVRQWASEYSWDRRGYARLIERSLPVEPSNKFVHGSVGALDYASEACALHVALPSTKLRFETWDPTTVILNSLISYAVFFALTANRQLGNIAYSAGAFVNRNLLFGYYDVFAQLSPADVPEATRRVLEVINDLPQMVDRAQLELHRNIMIGLLEREYDGPKAICQLVARGVRDGLTDLTPEQLVKSYERVGPDDLMQAAEMTVGLPVIATLYGGGAEEASLGVEKIIKENR